MPSVRKETLAALDALQRVLNKGDEFEIENAAAKRDLEATQAALAETRARLETSQAEFIKADAEHTKWREAAAREQAAGNAQIDVLQERLRLLEQQVAERRSEHDNIVEGLRALHQRMSV